MQYIFTAGFDLYGMAEILIARKYKEPLSMVFYPEVMFDRKISGEIPEHRDFIYQTAIQKIRAMGILVVIRQCETTYCDSFSRIVKESPYADRAGKKRGFPGNVLCYMRRDAKRMEINRFIRESGEECIEYVGNPKKERVHKARISLIRKYGMTKDECYKLCESEGLLSPAYAFVRHPGCWFCPNSTEEELRHLNNFHPELWEKLCEMGDKPEELASPFFSGGQTISEIRENFFWEEQQLSIFDFI